MTVINAAGLSPSVTSGSPTSPNNGKTSISLSSIGLRTPATAIGPLLSGNNKTVGGGDLLAEDQLFDDDFSISNTASLMGKHHSQQSQSISRFQRRLMIAILSGFTGYYFCRTNLVVSMNSILKSLPGVDKGKLGTVLSFGYLFYAIGKLVNGALIDIYGGRRMFLVGLLGTISCTLLFTLGPWMAGSDSGPERTLFVLGCVWSLNRFFQSAGWGALVKVLSHAFPASMHGRVLGMATLSYGAGDVIIRLILGMVLAYMEPTSSISSSSSTSTSTNNNNHNNNFTDTVSGAARAWQAVFLSAFFIACGLAIPGLLWLRDRSGSVVIGDFAKRLSAAGGVAEFDNEAGLAAKTGFIGVILQLAKKPKFWILFSLSPCLTLIRETLATWTQVMLVDLLRISDSSAAMMSLIFPLFGTVSTLLGGYAIDKSTPFRRGFIPVFCLFFLTFSLALSSHFAEEGPGSQSVFGMGFLVMLLSLSLMAPFSFVDGLFILGLVSRSGQGIAIGLINCVGYVGAIMAGHAMGSLAESEGWSAVFSLLTSVSIASCVLASLYWWFDVMELKTAGVQRLGSGDSRYRNTTSNIGGGNGTQPVL